MGNTGKPSRRAINPLSTRGAWVSSKSRGGILSNTFRIALQF
jgi:hypothetical protein